MSFFLFTVVFFTFCKEWTEHKNIQASIGKVNGPLFIIPPYFIPIYSELCFVFRLVQRKNFTFALRKLKNTHRWN